MDLIRFLNCDCEMKCMKHIHMSIQRADVMVSARSTQLRPVKFGELTTGYCWHCMELVSQ